MEGFGPIADARESFVQFVMSNRPEERDADRNPAEKPYLQTYIMDWLLSGEGVKATRKSYETYLRVLFNIGDLVFRGPHLHHIGAPPEVAAVRPDLAGLHEPGYEDSVFLERETYEMAVFQYEEREAERLARLATGGPPALPAQPQG